RLFPRNRASRVVKLLAVAVQEDFPGAVAAFGAGARQRQLFEAQARVERRRFCLADRLPAGAIRAIEARSDVPGVDFSQDLGELLERESEAFRSRLLIECDERVSGGPGLESGVENVRRSTSDWIARLFHRTLAGVLGLPAPTSCNYR